MWYIIFNSYTLQRVVVGDFALRKEDTKSVFSGRTTKVLPSIHYGLGVHDTFFFLIIA